MVGINKGGSKEKYESSGWIEGYMNDFLKGIDSIRHPYFEALVKGLFIGIDVPAWTIEDIKKRRDTLPKDLCEFYTLGSKIEYSCYEELDKVPKEKIYGSAVILGAACGAFISAYLSFIPSIATGSIGLANYLERRKKGSSSGE